jgi:hypothetical protein
MLAFFILLGLSAKPFWEAKPPAEWTDEQVQEVLSNSPWAQSAETALEGGGVTVYLATARPIQEAERELLRRATRQTAEDDESAEEYRAFLRENQGKCIVLAVRLPGWNAPAEAKKMEEESVLKVGRKKYKMAGHFPPTPADPYLRLVFPRAVSTSDKAFSFELYLPSVPGPYRPVEFRVKDLTYKSVLEM